MATDIALRSPSLRGGSRVPAALKVFVAAFAVMDDLGAIVMIAVYTANFRVDLVGAFAVWLVLSL